MKVAINQKLIARNARIGQYTSIGALLILGAGLYITFKMPDKFAYSLVALLIGFFLSQVGIYYGNRWGRNPRPDQIIDRALKGLGREFTIYHYVTPATHLLVGPAGIWVLLPYYQKGTVSFEKNRWRIKGGGFAQNYLRLFGQENIGRPDLDAAAESDSLKRYLLRRLPEGAQQAEINVALLFANPDVNLKVEQAPLPAMKPAELKDFMKVKAKEKPIGTSTLELVRSILPEPEKD
jgi:hypothetical protein